MNVFEFSIARQADVLREIAKRRMLTEAEREFLKRVAPLLRRLAEQEQKRLTRGARG